MKYIQSGRNDKYPNEILVWRVDDSINIPDWITDNCRIKAIGESGDNDLFILDTRHTSTGGLEFLASGNKNIVLFSTKTDKDYACYDPKTNKIFSLTEAQLNLLYEKE